MKDSASTIIAKNSVFLFARMFLVFGVTLYTSRLVLRSLGFEDYGIYNVVGSIIVFFGFLRTALTNATFRFITYELGRKNYEKLKAVYSMAINCHIILAFIICAVLEIIGLWFLNNRIVIEPDRLPAANFVFQFTLISFFVSIIQTPFHSNIIAHEKMSFYAILSILEVLLRLGIAFLLTICCIDKLVMYGLLTMVVTVLIFIVYVVFCTISFKDSQYIILWDTRLLKQFFSYSGWSLLVNTADVCTQQSISIYFNLFIGVVANAALGIANQVSAAVNTFLQNFVQACNPQIVKSYAAKEFDYFMRLVYSSSKVSFLLLLLVAVPLLSNTTFILNIWLGEYPENTDVYVQLMIVYYLIDASQTALWQAMHATGKIKTHQILIGSLKFLNVPLIFLCMRTTGSGVLGLSIWVSINLICAVSRTVYMNRLINLDLKHYFKDVISRIISVSIVTIFVCVKISNSIGCNWKGFLISSVVSTILVSVLSYTLCFNKYERNLAKSVIRNFIKIKQ